MCAPARPSANQGYSTTMPFLDLITLCSSCFLDGLRERVFQLDQREPAKPVQPCYVVVWDNVSFHRSAVVRDWFNNNPRFSNIFLPAYSPFLNPSLMLFQTCMNLFCGKMSAFYSHSKRQWGPVLFGLEGE